MGDAVFATSNNGAVADEIINLAGIGNQLLEENTVQLSDNARVIGGDSNEMAIGSTLQQLGAGAVLGTQIGDNSSIYMTSMDANTQALLDQALTVVGSNANNMMALASNVESLPDQSVEILAEGTAEAKASKVGVLVVAGLTTALIVGWFRRKKK